MARPWGSASASQRCSSARRSVVEVVEQGGVAVQSGGGVEPGEQTQGDDQCRVAAAEVVGRATVAGLVGATQAPALLVDDESEKTTAQHVSWLDAENGVGVPVRAGAPAAVVEGAVVARLVVEFERGEALAGDPADEVGLQ